MGVIYLERVFEQSNLVAHRSAELRALGRDVQARLEAMSEELQGLETELRIRPTSHPRYPEFREQFEVAKLRRDLYREHQAERLQRREMELLRQSYEDLRQLVQEFAVAENLQLVLFTSDADLEAGSVQGLRLQLGQRAVLYHRPEMDVTQAFIAFANSRFRGGEESPSDAGEE